MTVAELIEKLRAMPQELPVEFYTYDDYQDYPVMYMPVDTVELADTPQADVEHADGATLPAVRIS